MQRTLKQILASRSTVLVIGILACFFMSYQAQPVYAEETSQVSITSNFPSDFTASLKYASDTPITDVSLVFHVSGQELERYYREPLDPTTKIDINYRIRTDTTHRYIPPGSIIRYHFEITHQGNRTVATSPNQFMYLDKTRSWQSRSSNGISVVFYGNAQTRALSILDTALVTVKSTGKLFGILSFPPITIVVYESWEDMLPAIRFSAKTLQEELITLGQAHPAAGIIMLIGGDKDVLSSTRHEIIHMLIYSILKDSDSIVPFWFSEGIAEFNNPTHVESYSRAISGAIRDSSLPSLEHFKNRPNTPGEIWLMYAVGSSFTEFLITSKGTDKMQSHLEGLAEGKSFEESFQKVYSSALIELENEWRSTIGAPPIKVPNKESSAIEASKEITSASPTPMTPLLANPADTNANSRFSSCRHTPGNQTSLAHENILIALLPAVMSLVRKRTVQFTAVSKYTSKSALAWEEQNTHES